MGSRRPQPLPGVFVIRLRDGADEGELQERARSLGTLEPAEERAGFFLLHVAEPSDDPSAPLKVLREALGAIAEIDPVLVDERGGMRLPTGMVAVRFHEPPTEPELEAFASRHHLRLQGRNKFVPAQVEFRLQDDAPETLLECLEAIEEQEPVQRTWADTLQKFRRQDPGA